ncbi:MAG: PspC domain-containing protein [Candidatus Hydrogenedens sp.]|nr:PspC domain-containing protein [Candidatus Hydrogenedens sp.]
MSDYGYHRHGGPYRSRDGMVCGVCKGLANHLDISVFWTRMLTLVAFLMTGLFPVAVIYVCAALLMKREPILPTGYDPSWHERLKERHERPAGSFDERLSRVRQAARG